MKVLSTAEMRRAELAAVAEGISLDSLMENAGLAVAAAAVRGADDASGRRVLALVGPGNNGGDGLVAARHLHDWGAAVTVWLATPRDATDKNLKLLKERDIECVTAGPRDNPETMLDGANLVIDAIFGTGKVRPLGGAIKEMLAAVAEARATRPTLRLVAVDLPSGLNADTGAVDALTPQADETITLGYPKLGLYLMPGAEKAGVVNCAEINIKPHLVADVLTELITAQTARGLLPTRPAHANKGTFGRALVLAGSPSYVGAAGLAAGGALRVGAGLVTLALRRSLQSMLVSLIPEATFLLLPESGDGITVGKAAPMIKAALAEYNVLLAGCGLGQQPAVAALLKQVLLSGGKLPSLVLDADALNIIGRLKNWWRDLPPDSILTPHPGEMSRLSGRPVAEIQADRIALARRYAAEWGQVVVLKGAHTVVGAPDGRVAVSPFANPGLASAGTGDVLAGAVAGLLAQGLAPFDAARLGVYLHGAAGERRRRKVGTAGILAGDLLPALPRAIRELVRSGYAAGS